MKMCHLRLFFFSDYSLCTSVNYHNHFHDIALNLIQSDNHCNFFKVPGKWGDWEEWSVCSATCGTGNKVRTRECNNPAPQYGGECPGNGQETEACEIRKCPTSKFTTLILIIILEMFQSSSRVNIQLGNKAGFLRTEIITLAREIIIHTKHNRTYRLFRV